MQCLTSTPTAWIPSSGVKTGVSFVALLPFTATARQQAMRRAMWLAFLTATPRLAPTVWARSGTWVKSSGAETAQSAPHFLLVFVYENY